MTPNFISGLQSAPCREIHSFFLLTRFSSAYRKGLAFNRGGAYSFVSTSSKILQRRRRMRKLMFVVGLVCLCATVALSQNEGKVSNGWSCSKPEQMNSIDVGDQPGHAYAIEQLKCTSTKGEYAGVREKEGTGTEFVEVTGNKSSGHGVFVETFANGDKATFTYQFTGAMADGKMQSGTNKWQATSGTGKFQGMKASGTCKATGNPDGSTNFACEGTYSLPK
jgi:hypothetical protein